MASILTKLPRSRRCGGPALRAFDRLMHLEHDSQQMRHGRLTKYTDTKEKPFLCKCGAAFTRRDLLTRHYRLSKHDVESISNATLSSRESDFDKTAAAESLSCLANVSVQQWPPNSLHTQPVDHVFGAVDQRQPDGPRDAYHQSLLGPHMFTQGLFGPSIQYERMLTRLGEDFAQFDQFREFADFLDGIGLPAEWSPYFNPPEDFVDPDLRHGEASSGGSGPTTRPGTPFSSWLPSAPAGNKITGPVSTESELPCHCSGSFLTAFRSQSTRDHDDPIQDH